MDEYTYCAHYYPLLPRSSKDYLDFFQWIFNVSTVFFFSGKNNTMRYIMKLNICFFKINDPPTNSQTPKCWSQGFRRYPAPCLAGSMLVGVRIINDNHPMYTQRSMNHWSPITLLIRFVIPMIHQCPFVTHVRSPQKHTKSWSTGTHEPRPFQEES